MQTGYQTHTTKYTMFRYDIVEVENGLNIRGFRSEDCVGLLISHYFGFFFNVTALCAYIMHLTARYM